jgi:hypothetical protein
MMKWSSLLIGFALLLCTWSPRASDVPDPAADRVLKASGFLDGHPDLRYRLLGLEEYGNRNLSEAFGLFERAALYADKPSQAIVGEMYWVGAGTEQNRALGYVWMSLAAERGYHTFSKKRDAYWRALTEDERKSASLSAPALKERYGDAAAEQRLASALRRGRSQMTGSRLGSQASSVQIVIPGHGSIEGSRFYDSKFWNPEEYRAWHDAYWMDLRFGRVDLGSVEQVKEDEGVGTESPATNDPLGTED